MMVATIRPRRRMEPLWHKNAIIYDYLAWLGVDVVWLSPIYPSPMGDFGYDVADYTDVEPMFGSLAEFDHLVDEAHARDIKVILDFVPSHASEAHPWFAQSRASRDNPKRDWLFVAQPRHPTVGRPITGAAPSAAAHGNSTPAPDSTITTRS